MAFPLLLVCIALLFNRPGDWVPALAGLPLFQIAILGCLSLSIGPFITRLSATSSERAPVSVCVNGLLVVVALSGLVNGSSFVVVSNFAKAWALYFLVLALVDTHRLKAILSGTALSIFAVGLLMVLDHHTETFGGVSTVKEEGVLRAQAVGGGNFDANDTAALLVVAVLIFLALTIDGRSMILRCLCLVLAGMSLYAIQLCNSRGSLLALLTGLATYVYLRWGKEGLKWGALLLPVFVVIVATDRMTDVTAIQHGTGQSRMQFWSMGLSLFFRNPIIGIGPGEFTNRVGMACHNTFMQAFAELGFVGGGLFLGAFYIAITSCYRIVVACKRNKDELADYIFDPLVYLIPAVLAAYSVSLLTLNHLYGCHTYLLLAVSTVTPFRHCSGAIENYADGASDLITKLMKTASIFLIVTYVTCRVFVRW